MLKKLRRALKSKLGFTALEDSIVKLQDAIDAIWNEIENQTQNTPVAPKHVGGSVEASGRTDYVPNQTGNVVVAEPKLMGIHRSRHGDKVQ